MHKKTQSRLVSFSRILPRPALALLAGALGLAAPASAAEWYLKVNQGAGRDWSSTYVADWAANADGTGASPASVSAADTFDTNNRQLRSPGGNSGAVTFGGGLLRMTGGSSVVGLKTSGTAIATVPKLRASAGSVDAWNSGTQYFHAGEFENVAPASGFAGFKAASGRTLVVTVGKTTGAGETRVHGGGTIRLSLSDSERYLGALRVSAGTLNFDNDALTSGPLVVDAGALVVLDQAVSFAGLAVAGVEYSPGTYSYATLQAAHPAVFTSGTAGGSITVRAPRTWYLTVNQGGSQNWTEAFLSNWNSAANGSGVAPTTINGYDLYLNQVSNREVRTPTTASTFAGGALVLSGNAKLTVKTPAAAVSTIPALVTGNASIVNGYGSIRQDLAVGDWETVSGGVTKISASTGRSLAFSVEHLSGPGGVQTHNGGAFYLSLHDGLGHTGLLDHASGSLRFESVFSTAGSFAVGSAATVHLDKAAYFAAFSVEGVAKSAGFHTYAALNAAHPARFPSGSASGLVAVYTPDTAGPVRINGVNLSGPESVGGEGTPFPGTYGYQWIYPTEADFDYYASKGLNLLRIPFRWERMQGTLGGALNSAELARMDTAVARASARGMKVILDMHNYARYRTSGGTLKFGDSGLPASHFADVWRRLADHYKNEPAIYGFDIMNEPWGMTGGVWPAYAQAAVHAIREVNLNTWVIVEGETWANAWGFETKNPFLHNVRDPVGRLMFSAHSYWSDAGTDVYKDYDAEGAYPEMGVNNVKPFIDWLKKHDAKGFVGEYAVPNDDPRWLVVLANFLAYLEAEGVSGTYWAGGAWLGGSPVSCHPSSNYTVDRPVMTTLEDYP